MESFKAFLIPGFQSKPWAEISQRFQRIKCSPVRDGKTKYISERFQR